MKTYERKLPVFALLASLAAGFGVRLDAEERVLWHNAKTGVVAAWALDEHGTVTGTEDLDWRCDAASGCSSQWRVVGTATINPSDPATKNVVWYNAITGVVGAWLATLSGIVTGTQDVDWRCDAASGCSSQWTLVGTGDFNGDGITDVLWHNPITGVVGAWLLDSHGTVIKAQNLSWRCGPDNGCSRDWKAVAVGDFNGDGVPDVLWQNATTGVVAAWLLDFSGNVMRALDLSWRCGPDTGCSRDWRVVGTGDFNGDYKTDVLWFNATTGVVGAWLLDGSGTVTGTMNLSWRCGADTDCSTDWKPVGIMSVYYLL